MRVIALTTATPEVRPGARVHVDAIVVDPQGPRDVAVRWRLCRESGVGDPRGCAASPEGLDLGEGPRADLPVLSGPDGVYLVFAAACVGGTPTLDATIAHFRCVGGAPAEEVFRRVTVRTDGALNRPPAVARWVLRQGAREVVLPDLPGGWVALPACAARGCAAWSVEVTPTEDAAESAGDGSMETLGVSFFVSAGATERPRDVALPGEVRALTTRWTLGEGSGELWVVLRDQRGGETVRGVRVQSGP